MAVLELIDSLKLISCKIWMPEKSWNFHTMFFLLRKVLSFPTNTYISFECGMEFFILPAGWVFFRYICISEFSVKLQHLMLYEIYFNGQYFKSFPWDEIFSLSHGMIFLVFPNFSQSAICNLAPFHTSNCDWTATSCNNAQKSLYQRSQTHQRCSPRLWIWFILPILPT